MSKILLTGALITTVVVIVLASRLWAAPLPQSSWAHVTLAPLGSAAFSPQASATATATPLSVQALAPIKRITVTPPLNGMVITLTTTADVSGWATDLDGRVHFNVPNIHGGSYQGQTYYGALQFDLSVVPPGSTISYAALELVGLDNSRLGQANTWQLQLLDPAIDDEWSELTFDLLHKADTEVSILYNGEASTLAPNGITLFPFNVKALTILQQHLGAGKVSFRLDGPAPPKNSLFTWESGHSHQADASRSIILSMAVIPPTTSADILPSTPIFAIVTSTPTPKNVITLAAMAAEATRSAKTIGTSTPVPENWVTPVIVTIQPTPVNTATAIFREKEVTAQAFLYGSATATPFNVWTATPTSAPVSQPYLPVSTPSPSPTATATPIFVRLQGEVATPWTPPSPTLTPTPVFIPPELVGQIAFLSNRSGGPEPLSRPLIYVIDPDGSNLAVLTGRAIYDAAIARDRFSADQRFRVFVKDALRFDHQQVPALYFYDYLYNAEEQITHFGLGLAWDPVWSPTHDQIAFVSNDSSDDEIWVINRDGSQPRQVTESNEAYNAREIGKDTFIPEVNGHPSWSPDGSRIVFWSNRTGNRQLWIMNADGSNLYSLSTTNHDDWDPVWIKYTDSARNH